MINVSEEMKHLNTQAKRFPSKRFDHLWEHLTRPEWLTQAWEQIRSNKGSMTAGVDNTIAVDVDEERIKKLADRIKTGTYRPKAVRRVYIPKANGKKRPLGIPTLEDRIVQQAVKMLLEPIFEADFLPCSHGFRSQRSTHTALRDVAVAYTRTTWTIEGDIEGCFDNIPHGKLMKAVERRVADEKLLRLLRQFLEAGYMEMWQYHKTYSGTPQGGVLSPLLANIFLHQLDEYMEKGLGANRKQTRKEASGRRSAEYRKVENASGHLRKKLRATTGASREPIIKTLKELERQLKRTPMYAKDRRHPSKLGYVRYADDFVILVQGQKQEAEALRNELKEELRWMGLTLSEEKTKVTHWRHRVQFLGYQIQGLPRKKGIGIRARLTIPRKKLRTIKEAIKQIGGYHQIPEADTIIQMGAMYRGWCNYYRYANAPQAVFNNLASHVWWQYAHYLARKQRLSIAKMIKRERLAKRLQVRSKGRRQRDTYSTKTGDKTLILDIFPPDSGQIKAVPKKGNWTVDLKPVIPSNWQSGRSLATRLAALDRAKGVCERCQENPVAHVHHTIALRGKSFVARTMSDSAQRYTARALCKECHLEAHGGSYAPRKQWLSRKAGYAERCLPGLGSAS